MQLNYTGDPGGTLDICTVGDTSQNSGGDYINQHISNLLIMYELISQPYLLT
jgi:hypothetical protein